MLAVGNGLEHQRARRLDAADEFHDDVDVGVVDELLSVTGAGHAIADDGLVGLGALGIAGGHHRDRDAPAGAAADLGLVALQDVEGAGTDGAEADQADLDGLHCRALQGREIQAEWRRR